MIRYYLIFFNAEYIYSLNLNVWQEDLNKNSIIKEYIVQEFFIDKQWNKICYFNIFVIPDIKICMCM